MLHCIFQLVSSEKKYFTLLHHSILRSKNLGKSMLAAETRHLSDGYETLSVLFQATTSGGWGLSSEDKNISYQMKSTWLHSSTIQHCFHDNEYFQLSIDKV